MAVTARWDGRTFGWAKGQKDRKGAGRIAPLNTGHTILDTSVPLSLAGGAEKLTQAGLGYRPVIPALWKAEAGGLQFLA